MSTAPFVLTDAEWLERAISVGRLWIALQAEGRVRGIRIPLIPTCGHPDAPVSAVRGENDEVVCVPCGRRHVYNLACDAQTEYAAKFNLLPDSSDHDQGDCQIGASR